MLISPVNTFLVYRNNFSFVVFCRTESSPWQCHLAESGQKCYYFDFFSGIL